jgi:hypothetical protein
MTDQSHPENERLLDLLAAYSVQELTPEERDELKMLLEQEDGFTAQEFEVAAAAMHLAMSEPDLIMPDALADKVIADANEYFEKLYPPTKSDAAPSPSAPPASPASSMFSKPSKSSTPPTLAPGSASTGEPKPGFSLREGLAWLVAATAVVLFVVNRPGSKDDPVDPGANVVTAAESRETLLKDDETIKLDWQTTPDPAAANASGDIVWNTKRQQGFMRIADLKKNDPKEFQYQLWIFDHDQIHPIDGGVFDITDAEQLIPIDAKIAASDVFQFAITIEKPGGVVVSEKERIPLLAQVTPKQ